MDSTLSGKEEHDGGYRCVDALFGRSFSAEDALNLSVALECCLADREYFANIIAQGERKKAHGPMIISEDMTIDDVIDANAPFSLTRHRECIAFLRGGGFNFFWDD